MLAPTHFFVFLADARRRSGHMDPPIGNLLLYREAFRLEAPSLRHQQCGVQSGSAGLQQIGGKLNKFVLQGRPGFWAYTAQSILQ